MSKGIEVMSVAGPSDKICTIVRAIEANYVEMSESYSFPDTVQTLLWAQCDPNHCGADRLPLSQAIRSGDDRAIEQLLRAKANPTLAEQGQRNRGKKHRCRCFFSPSAARHQAQSRYKQ